MLMFPATEMYGYEVSQVTLSSISVFTSSPTGCPLVPSPVSGMTGTMIEARLMVNNITITSRALADLFM